MAGRRLLEGPGVIDSLPGPRLLHGAGAIQKLPELTSPLNVRRILLVSDPGIAAAGHLGRVLQILQSSGAEVAIYADVAENPSSLDVELCADAARRQGSELLIGLGGGSSIDTARGACFILGCGGQMQDYWGFGKATKPLPPLIAIPTTAGTGSEVQCFALISHATSHAKMACGDPKAMARAALLDPELTLTMPREVTAVTGLDALVHALEAGVTRAANILSLVYARQAFALILRALPQVLSQPDLLSARADMQLGAALAGMAIENSMLGAAHAAANPLTANYGLVHGRAVALMLRPVFDFNRQDPKAKELYLELARAAGIHSPDPEAGLDQMAEALDEILRSASQARKISDFGLKISEMELDKLAQEASQQWTAQFNPRTLTQADFKALYRSVL